MGKIAAILLSVVFGGMVTSRAAEFRLINNQFTRVYTNTFTDSFTGTNSLSFTNTVDAAASIYHTMDFVNNPTGTNNTSVIVDHTLNGVDWTGASTINLTNYQVFETNYTGKWVQFRFRTTISGTNNGGMSFYYMSQ